MLWLNEGEESRTIVLVSIQAPTLYHAHSGSSHTYGTRPVGQNFMFEKFPDIEPQTLNPLLLSKMFRTRLTYRAHTE